MNLALLITDALLSDYPGKSLQSTEYRHFSSLETRAVPLKVICIDLAYFSSMNLIGIRRGEKLNLQLKNKNY